MVTRSLYFLACATSAIVMGWIAYAYPEILQLFFWWY